MPKPKFRGANFLKRKLPNIHPRDRIDEWKIFKGDTVQIVAGPRDVGKQGKVVEVVHKLNSVVVEDCRLGIKHIKPNPLYPKGGRIQKEMPIPVHQVQVVDPTIGQPTETELHWVYNPIKKRREQQRLSLATLTMIPVPEPESPFKKLAEGPLDTAPSLVSQITWTPDIARCPFPAPFMNELERMARKNREAQAL
ncbi:39S ribosomal protein L24, mitochondrial [Polyrhizophydium stewartii]|uniref:39S ribosomal protein L24, mitochondrial n=1 Tax=Polyrhizophydium stewartii TaxID=2732419 RepID=A0ABR4MW93_9FUNG|nr:Plastid ribosomal protein L24 [Polyrhizophydium stewartii]